MITTDVVIVGGGAAGLMAARILSKRGKKVYLLEARDRLGGRIHTIEDPTGPGILEMGAEFIHGDLPVTQQLLKEAAIVFHKTKGEMWKGKDGVLEKGEDSTPGWQNLLNKLKDLQQDLPFTDFLNQYFPGSSFEELREAACSYAIGFDTADPADVSTFALREEWLKEEDAPQYRIRDGCKSLIDFLAKDSLNAGAVIEINTVVATIDWHREMINVKTTDGRMYTCADVVITLPLGVLKALPSKIGAITFKPDLPYYQAALAKMRMGYVVKIIMEFSSPFWNDLTLMKGKDMTNMQFVFSNAIIPTWWTLLPDKRAVLTGWIGGLEALHLGELPKADLIKRALKSLSEIFNISSYLLNKELTKFHIADWNSDPFTRGSYSYNTVETKKAFQLFENLNDKSIYFAGEAFYRGPYMGTVEAALTSGMEVADKIE